MNGLGVDRGVRSACLVLPDVVTEQVIPVQLAGLVRAGPGEPAASRRAGEPEPEPEPEHRVGDAVPAARSFAAAATIAVRAGDVGAALDAAVQALVAFGTLADGAPDPAGEAGLAELLGGLCREFFDYDRALQFYELAARLGGGRHSSAARHIVEVLALQLDALRPGDTDERGPLLERAERLAAILLEDGQPEAVRTVDGPRLAAVLRCERGRPQDAWPLLEAASRACPGPPPRGDVAALHAARGRCLQALGRPVEAVAEYDAALTAFAADGDLAGRMAVLRRRSLAREEAGDLPGAVADARSLAEHAWARHQRQAGGFMDQVWSRAGVEGERRDLEARTRDLLRSAEQDPLTGLANRRGMGRFCAALAPTEQLCVVLVDVDHFKDVNDRFGHGVGDGVLREVGALLSSSVRSLDRVARWGGEEFLLVLPGGSSTLGAEAADRLRRLVEQHAWSVHAPGLRLTVSAGVAAGPAGEVDAVLQRADAAMYAAKRGGRNTVVCG